VTFGKMILLKVLSIYCMVFLIEILAGYFLRIDDEPYGVMKRKN
jgi:hypothetical protein